MKTQTTNGSVMDSKNGFSKSWNFSISPEFKKLMGKIPAIPKDQKVRSSGKKTPKYFYKMRSQKGFMILGYKSINGDFN